MDVSGAVLAVKNDGDSIPRLENDEPICLYSSDGSKCWIPNVPSHEKPSIGIQFKTWDDAVRMYKAYAAKAGFDVRMSTITWTKGPISHRYMVCSKAGTPCCKYVDTMDTLSSSSKRCHTNIKVTGCNACIKLKVPLKSVGFERYDFIEAHNHGLVSDYNMDLTPRRRQLQFSDKGFIQNLQTTGFGPVVAHRVQSSLKGGQRLVTGSKTDFKNHACNVRHDMIFVPFTGIDCHKKCVTFGAGLIHSETIDSYQWLLHTFLSAHGKQPRLVLTDQDPAMKQAISSVLNESTHRLCMWHITNKIPVKLKGEIQVNEEIRCRVNKLVWNVFIKPETFESRWHDLINEFNLSENKWLKDMFAIRESWVPAYFRDIPMCCLMKTTSRSESCNSQFKVYSSPGNNLVQFMNCFEMALNAQRHVQRELQNDTTTKTPPLETRLPIERHASYVYTITIFKEVQKEIAKGLYHCARTHVDSADGLNIHLINHKDKRNGFVGEFKCADRARGNIELLQSLVDQMHQIKDKIWETIPIEPSYNSNSAIIQYLIGYKLPEQITIKPPTGIKNKGSGSRKRKIGLGEKAKKKSKKPKRFCAKCNKRVHGHDSRNHKKVMEEKERRRKEREQRRKERKQRRKDKMATMDNQPAEDAETDETVDTFETGSSEDSDDTSDTDYNTE
ncbi:protein FAR1-RELATED SEQUENCE 5-like [Bidens hawaiensis]|uniref:protein FAR1-RELATED SEQUENCE 5-like n=1 Tax=Bidens hawaiensis TaxID=980011 RepID=UPI00404917BA